MNKEQIKDRIRYIAIRRRNEARVKELLRQPATQKRDALLWLLEGKPLSMAVAFSEMGIGCYRDIIYQLRRDGNDIRDFWCHKKGYRGRVVSWKVHYLSCYPESVIKSKI